jgi:drug/metabolite transporter (DMT)-like permease
VHFVLWFASLERTTVLRSTLLVCTTPVWAGLIDVVVERRWPEARWLAGVALALPGVGWMSGGGGGEASWSGDLLALGGAVAAAVYLRTGQAVRQQVGALAAMGAMCAVAAAALWVSAGVSGQVLWGLSPRTWALLVAAVLGPQLVGHMGFTWAVRWVPASTVALVVLLEPVGAAALAALVFGEVPDGSSIAGGLLVLAGVAVAVGARR